LRRGKSTVRQECFDPYFPRIHQASEEIDGAAGSSVALDRFEIFSLLDLNPSQILELPSEVWELPMEEIGDRLAILLLGRGQTAIEHRRLSSSNQDERNHLRS
jgi:hypothetical protein